MKNVRKPQPDRGQRDDDGETALPTLICDKQDSVGGFGGYEFDSGCNLSGVKKVYVYIGSTILFGRLSLYPSTIRRIYFEFETPINALSKNFTGRLSPTYGAKSTLWSIIGSSPCVLEVDANDPIVKIDVWTDTVLANAVRFHFRSGAISETYGTKPARRPDPVSFEGRSRGNSRLVGLHGRYGSAIDRLGFSFVVPPPPRTGTAQTQDFSTVVTVAETEGDTSSWDATTLSTDPVVQVEEMLAHRQTSESTHGNSPSGGNTPPEYIATIRASAVTGSVTAASTSTTSSSESDPMLKSIRNYTSGRTDFIHPATGR
mmetsp:Transcript_3484/g.7956  ORF Transcript_3484/g.7956 Transcript_3484/m.7956 type:complete len:316 (+) Transcript_3484:145-1092(+)|eukprot:CAMPEP_0201117480 /NCGR_PEP_ID=MMETSP0850-20130426/1419_1 /ASSEMBLY_ACC=CAM_ASM_000622 /TAXON_ID=183588 /ORGANISM="Pseudo-nitzschia fraudulenta, Strain WWA7" /LENGTH=315 /DNA_ID=CAMNT_0047381801 /DNA_START=121 /DNA_END=1068 /DNA_ORIENTATION=+